MGSSSVSFVYPKPMPDLTIEDTGGRSLGNCYSSATWRVTSLCRLSAKTLEALNAAGVLGFGQEFYVRSQADGKEAPAGHRESACVVVDAHTGKPTGDPAPDRSHRYPFYIYECESRCDSGD